MEGVIGRRVLQCSDGHLFTSTEGDRLLGSLHLGPFRMMPCPVDGQVRMMHNIDTRQLSPEAYEQIDAHLR